MRPEERAAVLEVHSVGRWSTRRATRIRRSPALRKHHPDLDVGEPATGHLSSASVSPSPQQMQGALRQVQLDAEWCRRPRQC